MYAVAVARHPDGQLARPGRRGDRAGRETELEADVAGPGVDHGLRAEQPGRVDLPGPCGGGGPRRGDVGQREVTRAGLDRQPRGPDRLDVDLARAGPDGQVEVGRDVHDVGHRAVGEPAQTAAMTVGRQRQGGAAQPRRGQGVPVWRRGVLVHDDVAGVPGDHLDVSGLGGHHQGGRLQGVHVPSGHAVPAGGELEQVERTQDDQQPGDHRADPKGQAGPGTRTSERRAGVGGVGGAGGAVGVMAGTIRAPIGVTSGSVESR